MYELRYLVRKGLDGLEKVLQYRTQIEVSDYSTEKQIKKKEWAEWRDVPTVKDK